VVFDQLLTLPSGSPSSPGVPNNACPKRKLGSRFGCWTDGNCESAARTLCLAEQYQDPRSDLPVFAFALLVAIVTTLVSTLIPAPQVTRVDPATSEL